MKVIRFLAGKLFSVIALIYDIKGDDEKNQYWLVVAILVEDGGKTIEFNNHGDLKLERKKER